MKGFRFDVINLIGKDEELVDCPVNDGKPAYTDRLLLTLIFMISIKPVLVRMIRL